jgi:hypothetical protein
VALATNEPKAFAFIGGPAEDTHTLPKAIEVEQALLGAILNANTAYSDVGDFLGPHHFSDPVHGRIFDVIAKVISAGHPASPVTLKMFFEHCPPIREGMTVSQYLGTLAVSAASTKDAANYGRLIFDLALRRKLMRFAEDVAASAIKTDIDVPSSAIIEFFRDRLEKIGTLTPSKISAIALDDFLAEKLVRSSYVVEGLLREKGIAMIYAWRGLGKTWFVLALGIAIATGGTFLKWKVETPRRVVHICGEMPADALQERLAVIRAGIAACLPSPDYYRLICSDREPDGLPDLATAEGQAIIERAIGNADVVILDNASTLFQSGIENEAESWLPVQRWLLKLRRQGRTVIIVHHSGKSGAQRGTSRREDVLDLVLKLKDPAHSDPTEGAHFEVRFEKFRGLTGLAVGPFEARLNVRDGRAEWTMNSLEDSNLDEILELKEEGLSVRAIAKQLGMSKSAVDRALQKSRGQA